MIDGKTFVAKVKEYFAYLASEYGFKISDEKIRGNAFYDVQFRDETKVISISYENIADYFLVIIYLLQNGAIPDYDDKEKTLDLNKLRALLALKIDKNIINLNNEAFKGLHANDELEQKLLKAAKDLRLCLKHYPFN